VCSWIFAPASSAVKLARAAVWQLKIAAAAVVRWCWTIMPTSGVGTAILLLDDVTCFKS